MAGANPIGGLFSRGLVVAKVITQCPARRRCRRHESFSVGLRDHLGLCDGVSNSPGQKTWLAKPTIPFSGPWLCHAVVFSPRRAGDGFGVAGTFGARNRRQ